jgi:predicted ATPase
MEINLKPLTIFIGKDNEALFKVIKAYSSKEYMNLLFPEMGLHPKRQVEVIEFLAILANSGISLLVATHSTYIVDHLVNLMKAAKRRDKEKERIKEKFLLKNVNAFIPQDKVSVYLIEYGMENDILTEEGLIDWSTFGYISNYVSGLYFEI